MGDCAAAGPGEPGGRPAHADVCAGRGHAAALVEVALDGGAGSGDQSGHVGNGTRLPGA